MIAGHLIALAPDPEAAAVALDQVLPLEIAGAVEGPSTKLRAPADDARHGDPDHHRTSQRRGDR
jgi:hypothetical protein